MVLNLKRAQHQKQTKMIKEGEEDGKAKKAWKTGSSIFDEHRAVVGECIWNRRFFFGICASGGADASDWRQYQI